MTLQDELLKIKKEKRLRWKEVGEALGVSESYAYYLANSQRKIREKFRPAIIDFINEIKNNSVEEINALFGKHKTSK